MPGGRPRKPTALHILHGNPGKRALPRGEPTPRIGGGRPPAWLRGRARRGWTEIRPVLEGLRLLTEMDRPALALLCDAYGEYIEAREVIRREGATYDAETVSGGVMKRAHPAVAHASDAWRRCAAMLSQFGMTPASRAKVSADGAAELDPLEQWMAGNGG